MIYKLKFFLNNFFSDLRTLIWFFLKGPSFYITLIDYTIRKFKSNQDTPSHVSRSVEWCKNQKIELTTLYSELGFSSQTDKVFDKSFVELKSNMIKQSNADFGGMGHVQLIYDICENIKAVNCIETGVAYGWSSEAFLNSISKRDGYLHSVDMPMIGQKDYHLIGFVVSDDNKKNWSLHKVPDKNGLLKAINLAHERGEIDLIHYDSDKSFYGRTWSQKIIFDALRDGGIFISDDIDDNLAFKEFVESNKLNYYVVEFANKYVGIIIK